MKKKKAVLISIVILLFLIIIALSRLGFYSDFFTIENAPTTEVSDKNLGKCDDNNGHLIVSTQSLDKFWKNYLPEIEIENEWIHSSATGYDIAIFGNLKKNSQQGVVNTFTVIDGEITSTKQILSPWEGGSLSVLATDSSKDYTMEVQDKNDIIYLFHFENGFTARGTYLLKKIPFAELDLQHIKMEQMGTGNIGITISLMEIHSLAR